MVDFHTHIFPRRFCQEREDLLRRDATFAALYSSPRARMATAQDLLAEMDRSGVGTSVALGIGWTAPQVAREANDALLEAASRYPGRVVPFCSVNPAWGEGAALEAERCALAGARGVGELHPDTQGFDPADRALLSPLLEVARRHRLVLLIHGSEPVGHSYPGKGRTTPERLLAFIALCSGVRVVCAHFGGGLPFYALMPEVAQALQETYFDSAASPFLYRPEVFSVLARAAGPERLLFGSDFPLLSQARVMRQVEEGGLTPRERALVLGGNARRVLGMGG